MKIFIRIFILIVVFVPLFWGIRYRVQNYYNLQNIKPHNFPEEYRTKGTPVEVFEVKRADLSLKSEISGVINDKASIYSDVDFETWQKIGVGDKILGHGSEYAEISGTISSKASSRDQDGLYRINVTINSKIGHHKINDLIPLDVVTGKIPHVLSVPIDAIQPSEGKYYIWKVKKEGDLPTAGIVEIKIGQYNYDFVEVKLGIDDGDFVIVKGQRALKENERLRIVINKEE